MNIELYEKLPAYLDAIDRLGETFAKSGMFRCTRIEQGRTIVVMCMTMNITPIEFLATYDLIDGVPRKKALACLADFKKRGGRWKWICEADDLEQAQGEFSFEGQSYTVRFTIEDAKRQGLVKAGSGWVKTPSNMLRARVITTAIGMLAPEIVAGADTFEPDYPQSPSLNLAAGTTPMALAPGPAPVAALPAPQAPPIVLSVKSDEAILADMALAPSIPAAKAVVQIEPEEEPMPPPQTVEPETMTRPVPTAPPTRPTAAPTRQQLDPGLIEEIGKICEGHFLEVATWMIKEGWIVPTSPILKTEQQAAMHLQRTLPNLTATRAKRVIAKKLAFMRAIEEIAP
jgi:hypothetical protein